MCDCYGGKCELCGRDVPIHIGDYSAPRNAIRAYCLDCLRKQAQRGRARAIPARQVWVASGVLFTDSSGNAHDVDLNADTLPRRRRGKEVPR